MLELSEAYLEKGLLSLCMKRFLSTPTNPPEEWGVQAFRRALRVLVLKSKLLDRAVRSLSDAYFCGMRILYDATEALLQRVLEAAQCLCDLFNAGCSTSHGTK